MPNLLAMSFEGVLAPSFDLRCLEAGRRRPDGWGIAWYPGGEPAATVLKEPAPPPGSIRSELVRAWEHLASSSFVLHIRHATWGQISDANTQPFCRSYGGRDWLLAHSGSLDHQLAQRAGARFLPLGSTDTEIIFCELLGWIADQGILRIGDLDLGRLHEWFQKLSQHGASSLVFTDGHDLVAYADDQGRGVLWLWEVLPPYQHVAFGDADLAVDLTRRGAGSRKGVIITAGELAPLSAAGKPSAERSDSGPAPRKITPGTMVVVRQGAIRAEMTHDSFERAGEADVPGSLRARPPLAKLAAAAEVKRFEVEHRTTYRYAVPVERSTHVLRLEPVHDLLQARLSHRLELSVDGSRVDYEDVFGNRVTKIDLQSPFTELTILSRSRVETRDTHPLSFHSRAHARSTLPLIWMPWQRHMLQPYLLPHELPETQLRELTDYAMSFVQRNDQDLLETLVDLNLSIFREYRYAQGTTTLATTPFDVYSLRRGVCQDFANLFICLARLLSVPARYVCGYVYTGPKAANRVQSEASHAWVQVYLPEVGWKGFDPTNGIVTQTDHIRVAHGRTYVDATPTSGTIFVGGGAETLEVSVRCEPCS